MSQPGHRPPIQLNGIDPVIVCYSRCQICGRRTPHEVCHKHSDAMGHGDNWPSSGPSGRDFNRNLTRMWDRGFYKPVEVCTDPACPQRKHDWSSNPYADGCRCAACVEGAA